MIMATRNTSRRRTMEIVAFRSYKDHRPVARGRTLQEVRSKALRAGAVEPVIHFEPPAGMRIIV